jgi:succinoglycan biosynthesis transport protein ExoP
MTLTEYLTTLRRHWVAILLLAVIGAVASYGIAEQQPTKYESSTSVLVTSELGGNGQDLVQGSTYVQNLVASYVRLVNSQRVLSPVIDELGLKTTSESLAGAVSAESPTNTVIINIHVTGTSPKLVAKTADAVTASLSRAVSAMSPTVGSNKPAIRLSTVQSARVAGAPYSPDKRRWVLVGLFIGLLIGLGYAAARRTFGSSFTDAGDIARFTDVPLVGQVVEAKRGVSLPTAVLENTQGQEAESLRGLAANLFYLGIGGGFRSMVITSALPGESKSSIATSLSLVLSEANHKVLLIDGDLRAPTLHQLTGLDNSIGLSTVLIHEHTVETAVQQWGNHGLNVLTSGPLPPNPSQLLNSPEMRSLMEDVWNSYDYVVVDSAPLLSVTDAVWLGHMADRVLLVVRRRRTKPRELAKALGVLGSSRTAVAGIVLSRVPRRPRRSDGYGYGHEMDPKPSSPRSLRRRSHRAGAGDTAADTAGVGDTLS